MNMQHPNAQVLQWLANGENVQCRIINTGWWDSFPMAFGDEYSAMLLKGGAHNLEFRLKPRTITVNGREVQAGETVAPTERCQYWFPCFREEELVESFPWDDDDKEDIKLLELGLVHLTKEAAIAHAKAMLNID